MAVQMPKNRRPPNMREGVAGSIKSPRQLGQFAPQIIIMATKGDQDMFFRSPVMAGVAWTLSGVTKDSTGAALGSCVVQLYYTSNDLPVADVVSDATTGAYTYRIGPNAGPFYAVGYKVGSPDVAGTTVNTLTPTAA